MSKESKAVWKHPYKLWATNIQPKHDSDYLQEQFIPERIIRFKLRNIAIVRNKVQ